MHGSSSFFAIGCCSALLAVACRRGSVDGPPGADGRAAEAASAAGSFSPETPQTGEAPRKDAALDADSFFTLLTGRPVRAKSIGHTSYVLKVTLEGGRVAVFKPRSNRPLGGWRYKGEIAAYRLAVALGLDNVLPAIPHAFKGDDLRALTESFDAMGRIDADGHVRGALMPWLDTYRVLPLEEPTWRARWEPWVMDERAPVPQDELARAGAISTMIAFDYLTANWDRWSGGNVAEDSATGKVLFVDNDGAFYDPPDAAALKQEVALVRRVARFSRRFVAALRALDPTKLASAIGDELPGTPLLPPRVLDGVDARRRTVLAVVDARAGDAGEGVTMFFE